MVDSLDSNNTTIELAEELINNTDAIDRMKINDLPLLWVNFYGTVALLEKNELNFWKQTGFDFKECVLELNDISYGIL